MDITAELLEPIWIDRESTVTLDNLQARTGKSREEIVAEALKHYKDLLDIADKFEAIGESYIEHHTGNVGEVTLYVSGERGTTN